MDRLLFLARHYLVTYGGIGKEKVEADTRASRAEGGRPPGHRALLVGRLGDERPHPRVPQRPLEERPRPDLSPYYFRIDEFNPFTGGKTYAAERGPFWSRSTAKSGPRRRRRRGARTSATTRS
jgi:hypothetical protein